jgi:hypothetical protein
MGAIAIRFLTFPTLIGFCKLNWFNWEAHVKAQLPLAVPANEDIAI